MHHPPKYYISLINIFKFSFPKTTNESQIGIP